MQERIDAQNGPCIRAVIFDVGGVLVRTEDPAPRSRLETRLGLSPGEAEFLVFNSPMGRAAQMGEITSQELWAWLQEHLDLDEEAIVQFQEEFFGGDRLDEILLATIRTLRPRYQTAIISNYKDDLNLLLGKVYPMVDAFDLVVGSAYERVMKPDAEIFERTLARLGRQPEETLFIDDSAHNVEGARAVGMYAIHFTPGIDLVAELALHAIEVKRNQA